MIYYPAQIVPLGVELEKINVTIFGWPTYYMIKRLKGNKVVSVEQNMDRVILTLLDGLEIPYKFDQVVYCKPA